MHFTKYYKWVSFRLKQPLSSWVQKPLSTHSTDFQAYCTLPVIFETISSSAVTVSHISSTVVILATSPCFGLECSRRCSRALNTHTHTPLPPAAAPWILRPQRRTPGVAGKLKMFVAAARVCKVGKSRLQFAVTMMFTRRMLPAAFRLITASRRSVK